MFISASCAVIVGSIITCIVRFPLWLSLCLHSSLSISLFALLSVFVCLDDTDVAVGLSARSPLACSRPDSSSVFHFA